MTKWIRNLFVLSVLAGQVLVSGTTPVLAAAGSPPNGPIDPVMTGSDLKRACGQGIEGYKDRVGEQFRRWMLMVQCRAVIGTAVDMVQAGSFTLNDTPRWQCVALPDDPGELAETFVTWVARRPPLMREPAAIAFVEAIELSSPCRDP